MEAVYNVDCFIATDDWEGALSMESNVIKLLRQLRKDSSLKRVLVLEAGGSRTLGPSRT
jgi:hypothetical protein